MSFGERPAKKEMIRERISGENFNHDIASVLRPEGQNKVHSSLYNCGDNVKALRVRTHTACCRLLLCSTSHNISLVSSIRILYSHQSI